MKKIYAFTLALAASASMLCGAQSLEQMSVAWAKEFKNGGTGTSLTTQAGNMALDPQGNLLVCGQMGSTSADQSLLFGDATIGTGTNYAGNSANQGLVVAKLSADGNLIWSMQSTQGEVSSNEVQLAATADGGAVVFANMRHSEGYTDQKPALKDALGNTTEIDWTTEGTRNYRGVVFKLNADGEIQWLKQITANTTADAETYPKWNQSSRNIGQGIYTYDIAVDNAGNIFLGGRQTAAITIDNVTIEPHNVATWTGNASSVGNMYIIKLDSEGNYLKHFVSTGASTYDNVERFLVVGNSLYVGGLIQGLKDTEVSLGDKAVTATNTYVSPYLALLDTDLNVEWLSYTPSTVSGSAWQMYTIAYASNRLYLLGSAKYGITIGETTYTNNATSHAREPWIIQFDTDGNPTACNVINANQHGFFGIYEGTDGNLYVIDRGLTPANANWSSEGSLLQLNPETLAVTDQVEYCDLTCDGQVLITDGTRLYAMFRHGNRNADCTFYNSNLKFNSDAFRWTQIAMDVPVGAVKSVTIEDVNETITLQPGQTVDLFASVLPVDPSNAMVIWTSTDESLVSVDEDGTVTALQPAAAPARNGATAGNSAIITATSDANPNVKASVRVIVDNTTGVTDIKAASKVDSNVYTIDGRLFSRNAENLPAGIYITNGKKIIVK